MTIFIDGKDRTLYQWDRGRRVILHGASGDVRVDFARCGEKKAVSKYAYSESGALYCDIPDILLTESTPIHGYVYEINGNRGETTLQFVFPVIPRPKPEDYVEPEDVLLWHDLEERINELEQGGMAEEQIKQIEQNKQDIEALVKDKLDADELPAAVNDALAQAKASGEFKGDPGERGTDGKDGKDGQPGEDGFSPVVAVEDITGGHRVTITDKDGAKTFDVMDGKDGQGGSGGVTSWNDLTDRPFGTYPPEYVLQWDGDMTGRTVVDLTPLGMEGTYLVKVSDRIYTQDELIGKYLCVYDKNSDVTAENEIGEHNVEQVLPGSFSIDDGAITVVYAADEVNAAFGAPDGYVTNGTYFISLQGTIFVSGIATTRGYIKKLEPQYIPAFTSAIPPLFTPMEFFADERGYWYTSIDGEGYDSFWDGMKNNRYVKVYDSNGTNNYFIVPLVYNENENAFYGRAWVPASFFQRKDDVEVYIKIRQGEVHFIKRSAGVSFDG